MSAFVFDVETQKLASEVGGWANIEALRLAVAVSWDEDAGYRTWWEAQAGDFIEALRSARLVVGFNVNHFDYRVLSVYGHLDMPALTLKTFDLFDQIQLQGTKPPSLDSLARLNLGEAKIIDGVAAVGLWRAGELEQLQAKCQKDTELTRRLYELWETQGILTLPKGRWAVWPGTSKRYDTEANRRALYNLHHQKGLNGN